MLLLLLMIGNSKKQGQAEEYEQEKEKGMRGSVQIDVISLTGGYRRPPLPLGEGA